MRGKCFELLDFPKFAYPSVVRMDPVQTSYNLIERLSGGGFMSYGQIWPRMSRIVAGSATDKFIETEFSAYADEWKNNSIQDVARLLRGYFKGRGRWYPHSPKPRKVLGFWFKPSIKGVWFVDGQAYAVLVNARKGQPIFPDHARFLARGIYELHCIDDPNDPLPLILDASEHEDDEGRKLRPHVVSPEHAISFEEFDTAIRLFLQSLQLAGVALPDIGTESVVDLFRRP
jgi:hypothetical protein